MLLVAAPVRIDLIQTSPILVPVPSGAPSQLGFLLLQNDSPYFLQVFQGGQVGGIIPPYTVQQFELAAIGSPAQVIPLPLAPGGANATGPVPAASLGGGWLNAIWSDQPLRDWPSTFSPPSPPAGSSQVLVAGNFTPLALPGAMVSVLDLTGWTSLDLMVTNNGAHHCRIVVTWSSPAAGIPGGVGVDVDTVVSSNGLEGHFLLPVKAPTATIAYRFPAGAPITDSITVVASGSKAATGGAVLSMHSQGSTITGNPYVFQAGASVGAGVNLAVSPLFDYTGPAQMWVRLPVAGCSVYLMDFDETGVAIGTPLQILTTDPTLNRVWLTSWRHQLQLSNTTAGAQPITCNVTPNA